MIVGFTGSQHGMSEKQVKAFRAYITSHEIHTFVHGDCIGADAQAHVLMRQERLDTKIFVKPCTLVGKRAFCVGEVIALPKAPLERNHDIVDCCDVVIATPATSSEVFRSGTWATIRYARRIGKPVVILLPC